MSLPINMNDLIHQRKVERTRIEYKSDWNPEPIIHSITVFANDFDNMGGSKYADNQKFWQKKSRRAALIGHKPFDRTWRHVHE